MNRDLSLVLTVNRESDMPCHDSFGVVIVDVNHIAVSLVYSYHFAQVDEFFVTPKLASERYLK